MAEICVRSQRVSYPFVNGPEGYDEIDYFITFNRLAESMHNLLQLTLAPNVPASLRNIPTKYNIIIRLWTHAFNKPLEALRRASF